MFAAKTISSFKTERMELIIWDYLGFIKRPSDGKVQYVFHILMSGAECKCVRMSVQCFIIVLISNGDQSVAQSIS